MKRLAAAALAALTGLTPAQAAQLCESVLQDPARERRVAIAITLPDDRAGPPMPMVIWSPGLGGGLAQGRLYAQRWAAAGIATVQLQHPGSDAQVYADARAQAAAAANPEAAAAVRAARIAQGHDATQIAARLEDVRLVMNHVQQQLPLGTCPTTGLDPARAGIAGHSMGAWIAQIMAGQIIPGQTIARPPFRAALAISGSARAIPQALPQSAALITGPFMLITSPQDGVPASGPDRAAALASRTALWPHLPPGEKYLFVARAGTHNQLSGTPQRMPPALACRISAITSDFWRASLMQDPAASTRLKATSASDDERFETR